MLKAACVPLDELAVPLNAESRPTAGPTIVDALVAGRSTRRSCPGQPPGSSAPAMLDASVCPRAGNLVVPYRMVLLSDDEAAEGFVNFVLSDAVADIITQAGYG